VPANEVGANAVGANAVGPNAVGPNAVGANILDFKEEINVNTEKLEEQNNSDKKTITIN